MCSTLTWLFKHMRGVVVLLTVLLAACAPSEPVFSAAEQGILASVSLQALGDTPVDPSNRVAGDPRAVALGRDLFFDPRLSAAGDQSCASCHQPDKFFTDGRPTGRGVRELSRNTATLVGAPWQTWFYWDGRRDSLWAQALVPIEAPDEMGGSRLGAVRLIAGDAGYRARYEALFGPLPEPVLNPKLPDQAGPFAFEAARNAWFGLPPSLHVRINTVFANIGKAIAAYEGTLTPQSTPFDRLMSDGAASPDQSPLSADALAGARLFADIERTRCLQCHNGPLLTNGDFHNVGSGGMSGQQLDFGRLLGAQAVRLDPFNCLGPFSDADLGDCAALRFLAPDQHGESAGAYKVPTLRNVAATSRYFHDGRFATLREVVQHYNTPPGAPGSHELEPLGLSEVEIDQLVAFLVSLTAPSQPGAAPPAATGGAR